MSTESELLRPQKDWPNNACLHFVPDEWDLYCKGYHQAGDIVAQHVVSTHQDQDTLVFPIVFLYRHYLELRLKSLARDMSRLLDKDCPLQTTHDLRRLWRPVAELSKQVEPSISIADLDCLESVIDELSNVDPKSVGFRYPEAKEGGPSLPNSLRHINVRHVAEQMTCAFEVLETIALMVSVYWDQKMEREAILHDQKTEYEAMMEDCYPRDDWVGDYDAPGCV